MDRKALEALFGKHGFADFTWIDATDIVVAHWVRMKCRHGCDDYGTHPMCPPNAPPVEECRRFFGEYSTAAILRMEKRLDDPEARHEWVGEVNVRLLALERDVFLAGNVKAFVLYPGACRACGDCPDTLKDCNSPESARPTPEGLAVDVFTTVRKYELPLEVLKDLDDTMNRYAFLLVE